MFIGQYQHNLDQKGRVSIPAKFRSALGSSAIVTRGLDNCLFLYPKAAWEEMAARIAGLPLTNQNARSFARLMLSGAMEVEIDKLGRILLPAYLREYSSIAEKATLAGVFDRVEIWDTEKWQDFSKQAETNSSDIAEKLTEWEV